MTMLRQYLFTTMHKNREENYRLGRAEEQRVSNQMFNISTTCDFEERFDFYKWVMKGVSCSKTYHGHAYRFNSLHIYKNVGAII